MTSSSSLISLNYAGQTKLAVLRSDGAQILPGSVYWMPSLDVDRKLVDNLSRPDSILWEQAHVNGRLGRHPTMVWDTYWHPVKQQYIARCLQATSFTDYKRWYSNDPSAHMTVEQKYHTPGSWKYHLQYLAIEHAGMQEPAHNMPVLGLKDGGQMPHQTYVHLDHYFEVEVEYLRVDNTTVALKESSFCVLMARLDRFVHKRSLNGMGQTWRRQVHWKERSTAVRSPLDYRYAVEPVFSHFALECAKSGNEFEFQRLAQLGQMQMPVRDWTGNEANNPYVNPNKINQWSTSTRPPPPPHSGPQQSSSSSVSAMPPPDMNSPPTSLPTLPSNEPTLPKLEEDPASHQASPGSCLEIRVTLTRSRSCNLLPGPYLPPHKRDRNRPNSMVY